MSEVCRAFGISRKTGYKIFSRYKDQLLDALAGRSRCPVQLPDRMERLMVHLKRNKRRPAMYPIGLGAGRFARHLRRGACREIRTNELPVVFRASRRFREPCLLSGAGCFLLLPPLISSAS
jgi:hypothetical protein